MLEDTKLIQCRPLHAGSKVRFTEKPKVSFMDLITRGYVRWVQRHRLRVQDREGDMVKVMVVDVDEGEAGVGGCQTSS